MFELNGKVAIITGGGRGIGKAIAVTLAKQGADIVIADLLADEAEATAAEVHSMGRRALVAKCDVSQKSEVDAMVQKTLAELGQIDILVNNAGWDRIIPFIETTPEFWDKVININLKGVICCTRAVLDPMIARGSGKIINIGSDAGRVGSMGEAIYSACKGGVIAFTKTIAREMARNRINVNCICPGPTETPLITEMQQEGGFAAKVLGSMGSTVPLKRLGEPRDIANAVAFMVSDEANYITGQTFSVSGGLTMS